MAGEPLFVAINDRDPAYQQSVRDARATLPELRRLVRERGSSAWYPLVKTRVTSGNEVAALWLVLVGVSPTALVGRIFEIPPEFATLKVGDNLRVSDDDLLDWQVNDAGTLHGGFSLRYQRSLLPSDKQPAFDEYIGVTNYAGSTPGRSGGASHIAPQGVRLRPRVGPRYPPTNTPVP